MDVVTLFEECKCKEGAEARSSISDAVSCLTYELYTRQASCPDHIKCIFLRNAPRRNRPGARPLKSSCTASKSLPFRRRLVYALPARELPALARGVPWHVC